MTKPVDGQFSNEDLTRLRDFFRPLLQREIAFERDQDWALLIVQRCRVCREDIRKRVTEHGEEPEVIRRIGAAARASYLLHMCPPVTASLGTLSDEDLLELFTELENDALRIDKRLAEVAQLRKDRGHG